jgi:hypothetical protein
MADLEFFILLVVLLRIWWILPHRRLVADDLQKILNALERIETKLGTNPDLKS